MFKLVNCIFSGNAAVYLVNCSLSQTICKHQNIQGYPSVKLFRSLAFSQLSGCTTDHIQQQYIVLDYHRPLQVYFSPISSVFHACEISGFPLLFSCYPMTQSRKKLIPNNPVSVLTTIPVAFRDWVT